MCHVSYITFVLFFSSLQSAVASRWSRVCFSTGPVPSRFSVRLLNIGKVAIKYKLMLPVVLNFFSLIYFLRNTPWPLTAEDIQSGLEKSNKN